MQITNRTNGTILSHRTGIANNFFSRLKGLLGTASLPAGQGLIIRPCNSVHTFGMRYAIDVLFVDRYHRILKVVPAMPPGKISMGRGSAYVIELPAGTVQFTGTHVGDQLESI